MKVLTGDNRPTAEAIGREAGVDEVLADLLPVDKVAANESLVAQYGQVAMVGDGINDAPAMKVATDVMRSDSASGDLPFSLWSASWLRWASPSWCAAFTPIPVDFRWFAKRWCLRPEKIARSNVSSTRTTSVLTARLSTPVFVK